MYPNELVCCQFTLDDLWYRACVVDVEEYLVKVSSKYISSIKRQEDFTDFETPLGSLLYRFTPQLGVQLEK